MDINRIPLWLSIPLSWLYAAALLFRNFLYRKKILKSIRFDIPVICVGNITTGGTGKTPMIEWMSRFLIQHIPVAILSRGYGRQSSGFHWVQPGDTARISGDEPLQIKRRFPDLPVAVSADRAFAIPKILMQYPAVKCVLMDDGLQHKAIIPGFAVLLTSYNRPYFNGKLLPAGYLRDFKSTASDADVVIVTKCPEQMSVHTTKQWRENLKLEPRQKLFFASLAYGSPYWTSNTSAMLPDLTDTDVLLVTGLADPLPLVRHAEQIAGMVYSLEFPDHHPFSDADIHRIVKTFHEFSDNERKIIMTTEKDVVRLESFIPELMRLHIYVFVIPVEHHFLFDAQQEFENTIIHFLMNFKI